MKISDEDRQEAHTRLDAVFAAMESGVDAEVDLGGTLAHGWELHIEGRRREARLGRA